MSDLTFDEGIEELKANAEAVASGRARLHYFKLDDGKSMILRFATARPWTVSVHGYVKTRNKPKDQKGNWPKSMNAVCRIQTNTKHNGLTDAQRNPLYTDCYICDNYDRYVQVCDYDPKAKPRGWAWAVEREEVIEDGAVVGYRDKMRTFKRDDGSEVTEKAFVLVRESYDTFWVFLQALVGRTGMLACDYQITRQGTKTATKYLPSPLPPVPMDDGRILDLAIPEHAERYEPPQGLADVILGQASDKHYETFFNLDDMGGAGSPAAPETDVDSQERLAAMAGRLSNFSLGDAAAAQADPEPAAAGAPVLRNFG